MGPLYPRLARAVHDDHRRNLGLDRRGSTYRQDRKGSLPAIPPLVRSRSASRTAARTVRHWLAAGLRTSRDIFRTTEGPADHIH
jgi:hypothetical protein